MTLGASGKFPGAVVSSLPQGKPQEGNTLRTLLTKYPGFPLLQSRGGRGTTSFLSSSVLGREGVCMCVCACMCAKSLQSCQKDKNNYHMTQQSHAWVNIEKKIQ